MPKNWRQKLIIGDRDSLNSAPPAVRSAIKLSNSPPTLNNATRAVFDAFSGKTYVASQDRRVVLVYDPFEANVSIYAGTWDAPAAGAGDGDGGAATSAKFTDIRGIATDALGNLYILDAGFDEIRKVTEATGIITTLVALTGNSDAYDLCWSDTQNKLYVADFTNDRVDAYDLGTSTLTESAFNVPSAAYAPTAVAAVAGTLYCVCWDQGSQSETVLLVGDETGVYPVAMTVHLNDGTTVMEYGITGSNQNLVFTANSVNGEILRVRSGPAAFESFVTPLGKSSTHEADDILATASNSPSPSGTKYGGITMDASGNPIIVGAQRCIMFAEFYEGDVTTDILANGSDPLPVVAAGAFAGEDDNAIGVLSTKWIGTKSSVASTGARTDTSLAGFVKALADDIVVFVGSSYSNLDSNQLENLERLLREQGGLRRVRVDFQSRGHGDGAVIDAGAPAMTVKNDNGTFVLRRHETAGTVTDYGILMIMSVESLPETPALTVWAAGLRDISTKAAIGALTLADQAAISSVLDQSPFCLVKATYPDTVTAPVDFTPSVANVTLITLESVNSATP